MMYITAVSTVCIVCCFTGVQHVQYNVLLRHISHRNIECKMCHLLYIHLNLYTIKTTVTKAWEYHGVNDLMTMPDTQGRFHYTAALIRLLNCIVAALLLYQAQCSVNECLSHPMREMNKNELAHYI